MHESTDASMGGRLTLLAASAMTSDQRELAQKITGSRSKRGTDSGYQTRTEDGRLIGPFNAFLREPAVGTAYLAWAQAIAASPLSRAVTEATILGVTARWQAPYVRYAHTIGARGAGFTDEDIDTILCGGIPTSASPDVAAALSLVATLLDDHRVPNEVYQAVGSQFGEAATVALVSLIGQYMTTSALLACFAVPAPEQL